jgi:hypothetical protein
MESLTYAYVNGIGLLKMSWLPQHSWLPIPRLNACWRIVSAVPLSAGSARHGIQNHLALYLSTWAQNGSCEGSASRMHGYSYNGPRDKIALLSWDVQLIFTSASSRSCQGEREYHRLWQVVCLYTAEHMRSKQTSQMPGLH